MSNYHIKQFCFEKALQLETAVLKPGSQKKSCVLQMTSKTIICFRT